MRIGNWFVLIAALEMVIREPDRYDQKVWSRRSTCGTVRCIAGWVAHFGGWQDDENYPQGVIMTVSCAQYTGVAIEHAALISLDLDPEQYGHIAPVGYIEWMEGRAPMSVEADDLARRLFSGTQTLPDILETVRDLAHADGVTLPPVIASEMDRIGIPA